MPTKNKKPETQDAAGAPTEPTKAFMLIFELEQLALAGRKILFDVMKDKLGEHKLHLTLPIFTKFCSYSTPRLYIQEILDALKDHKLQADKIGAEIETEYAQRLLAKASGLNPALVKIIRDASPHKIAVGAISLLPREMAESLMAKLGLVEQNVQLLAFDNMDKVFPRSDTWMKIAKTASITTRKCLVLATSMIACKSAMAADMQCVAIPDEYTSYQDFSGANMILDKMEDLGPKDVHEAFFIKDE